MAEIVNLRRVRKQRVRAEAEQRSAENRARFGRSNAEAQAEALRAARSSALLDGAQLQTGVVNDANDAATTS